MNLTKFLKNYQADIILAVAIVLISITSFNLGKISAHQQKKTPIAVTEPGDKAQAESSPKNTDSSVVASKNSKGKLYHFPWCSGASKIADKNKMTFATEAAAISAGYTLAGNCQK